MKLYVTLLLFACLMVPAEAKKRRNNRAAQERAKQERLEKERKRQERADKRDAVKEFLEDKDVNNDRSVSRDEYIAGESDKEAAARRFDEANKNGDRYLTRTEIERLLGID